MLIHIIIMYSSILEQRCLLVLSAPAWYEESGRAIVMPNSESCVYTIQARSYTSQFGYLPFFGPVVHMACLVPSLPVNVFASMILGKPVVPTIDAPSHL